MNALDADRRADLARSIDVLESQTGESLASIRLLEEHWDRYRYVLREDGARYEAAAIGMGPEHFFVGRQLAARRELGATVERLADQQQQLFAEAAHDLRSRSEAEIERLRREKAGDSWA